MQRKTPNPLVAVVIFIFTLSGTASAIPYSNLYVLGDSLSDVGNLLLATNGQLPQDPPYVQGRFSDGPVFAEHLWNGLGLPGELMPSYAGGTDFAVGGARTRYHAFDTANPSFNPLADPTIAYPFSLLGQRDTLLAATGGVLDPDALYSVWIGSNDVADAFGVRLLGGPVGYSDALLAQASSDLLIVIDDLVTAGAQHILLPNVPNLGLVPQVLNIGSPAAEALASSLALQFNAGVDAALAGMAANIMRMNTFGFLTDIVNDPTLFDLPANINVTDDCFTGYVGEPGDVCSDPENYLFWDRIHPSAVTHEQLGLLALAAVPEPSTWVLIVAGLAGMAVRSRRRKALL